MPEPGPARPPMRPHPRSFSAPDAATLAGAAISLCALLASPLAAQSTNLINNGDMARAIEAENLWEGVSSKGQLRVPTATRMAATSSGKVTDIPMPASVQAGDVTGDDLPDLVVADGIGFIWVFKNGGTKEAPKFSNGEILPIWLFTEERWGGYNMEHPWEHHNPKYVPRLHMADWDGNREPELVVGTFYGEVFRVPLNISGGRISVSGTKPGDFEINLRQQGEFWGNFFTPYVADWNGDGIRDLMVGEGTYACNAVYMLQNTGSNSGPRFKPEERKILVWGDGREQLKPVVVDWDGDGNLDLLVTDYKGECTVHLNKSGNRDLKEPLSAEGALVQVGSQKSFGQLSCVGVGDLNADGLFDLLIGKSDGVIQAAYNKGKAGAPKFEKIETLTGADIYPAYKRPVYWRARFNPGIPYYVAEQVNDPANTAGPNRSGGDCLKVWFVEPKQTVANGKFPEVGGSLKNFRNIVDYESRVDLVLGAKYEVSFWYRRTGFKSMEFEIEGWEWEETTTRRGEQAQWYGKKLLTHIRHLDELPPGNWRFFKKTYEIPGKEKGRVIKHWFQFLSEGTGEFYLDDVSMRKL